MPRKRGERRHKEFKTLTGTIEDAAAAQKRLADGVKERYTMTGKETVSAYLDRWLQFRLAR